MVKIMQSLLLAQLLVAAVWCTPALAADDNVKPARPSGLVYLIDLHTPRSVAEDELAVDGTISNSVADNKATPQRTLPLTAILLVNNPLKDEDAKADGIYFRPADGKPLDQSQSVSH